MTLQEKILDQIIEADKFHHLSATEEQVILRNIEKIVIDFGSRVFASCEWKGHTNVPSKEDYQYYLEYIKETLKDEFFDTKGLQ